MIATVEERNVNDAFCEALWMLKHFQKQGDAVHETRNGKAYVFPTPLVTTYRNPDERVLFWGLRDANPFLHFFESLWMLGGRNDVAFPAHFAKKFYDFSDDQETLNGAYGYRWRHFFGYDQLDAIVELLRNDPTTRRAVLQMWHPCDLADQQSKDLPCNLSVTFDLRGGKLNSYISNRSNDIVWGLYGANAVHFSYLQEYLAIRLNVQIGTMTTFSVNAHAYTWLSKLEDMLYCPVSLDLYRMQQAAPYPLMNTEDFIWREDLRVFLKDPGETRFYRDNFFNEVAVPMYRAWRSRHFHDNALAILKDVRASDWRIACENWIQRRQQKAQQKEAI